VFELSRWCFTDPVINGEKAAFNTPVFAQKRQRTLEMLIRSLYQEHMPENSKVSVSSC